MDHGDAPESPELAGPCLELLDEILWDLDSLEDARGDVRALTADALLAALRRLEEAARSAGGPDTMASDWLGRLERVRFRLREIRGSGAQPIRARVNGVRRELRRLSFSAHEPRRAWNRS